ncbi:MAG TPA: M14 family metallopeptidase [Acidobacteriota bacterium]|nr:M14 family metallopeptidase [Acidobacteriota bacterium]
MANTNDWLTHAERTQFQETSRYREVIDYCKRLQQASPWIRDSSFGKSPEGRDLPLLTVSSHGRFDANTAHKAGDVVVLIINGIHPGEIAGKEASFMLVRDIAITKQKASLLDHVVLLVVPIFSVDGHERMSRYNRINQNGPKEMGWRATSQNLNLNRDWMKADQPEMQAMLKLYTSWLPDFVIDNHVTDGADFQYDVLFIMDDHPAVAPEIRHYMIQEFEPALAAAMAKQGHITASYFELKDADDLSQGIEARPLEPRFSDGYGSLQNRPTVVVETHMLKSFEARIKAHYDLMEDAFDKFNRDPQALKSAIAKSDRDSATLGANYDPKAQFPVWVRLDTGESETFAFKGVEYTREKSNVSSGTKVHYGSKPQTFSIPFFHKIVPDTIVAPPLGYAIPPQWTFVMERFANHAVQYAKLNHEVTSDFETYRFSDVSFPAAPFEGRFQPRFKTQLVTESRILIPGTAVVWLNQRNNRVILGLLEPQAPDSLMAWGFFNAIFEQKEYAENYILEKLAADLISRDSKLKQEFENRLKSDPKFAADPAARLQFFYERSPYWDQLKNAYPIVRITRRNQIPQEYCDPTDH